MTSLIKINRLSIVDPRQSTKGIISTNLERAQISSTFTDLFQDDLSFIDKLISIDLNLKSMLQMDKLYIEDILDLLQELKIVIKAISKHLHKVQKSTYIARKKNIHLNIFHSSYCTILTELNEIIHTTTECMKLQYIDESKLEKLFNEPYYIHSQINSICKLNKSGNENMDGSGNANSGNMDESGNETRQVETRNNIKLESDNVGKNSLKDSGRKILEEIQTKCRRPTDSVSCELFFRKYEKNRINIKSQNKVGTHISSAAECIFLSLFCCCGRIVQTEVNIQS